MQDMQIDRDLFSFVHMCLARGYADHPQDERFTPHRHSHSRTVRPLENYYYSARPILLDPNFQNVTITWYRLSRSKVYPFHTLLTFLTPLNQERGLSFYGVSIFLPPLNQERLSIVLWSVDIFTTIKSRTMV